MIDGIETALELPPFPPALSFSYPPCRPSARPFPLEVYKETTMGRAVLIFCATPRDRHLTSHPFSVLFDCSMARATTHPSGRSLYFFERFSCDSPVKQSSPLETPQRLSDIFVGIHSFSKKLEGIFGHFPWR